MKKKGQFNGSFAPVTHFFGYQGRCSHPSLFDCSLGSTFGYGAAVLLEAGCTGMCVCIKDVIRPAKNWRIGGVPILTMVRSAPKQGYKRKELVVPS